MVKIDLTFGHEYHLLSLKKGIEKEIAQLEGIAINQVQLTNGSNGSLEYVLSRLSIRSLKKTEQPSALIDVPNYFDTLKFLSSFGYNVDTVMRDKDFEYPLKQIIQLMVTKSYTVVILTTPNNPTGIPISDEEIYAVLDILPEQSVCVIDRTCVNINKEVPTSKILADHKDKNVIILHSYSKSHNLSAQRIGYFACSNLVLGDFFMQSEDDGRVSYNAMYALQQLNENIVEENRCKIRRSIALLEKTREEYPDFSYTNTRSNFVLVALEDRYKKGLYKEFEFIFGDQYSLPSHCRINISEPANIELFLARYKTLREENAKI